MSTTEETKYASCSSLRKTLNLHTLTTDHTAFLVVRLQVGGWATKFRFRFASNSHFCDFFIEQTFKGFATIWKRLAGRKQGKEKKRLRRVETEPAALPCGDVTTSRASQGLASCQTSRDTQLSHLVSVGDEMTANVQMGGSTNCHMKLSHASRIIILKKRKEAPVCWQSTQGDSLSNF